MSVDLAARWHAVVDRADGQVALDEAAMIIAAHIEPAIDVDEQLGRLDAIAADCGGGNLEALGDLLFVRLGLRGNTRTYHDPRNSSLPWVLDRRMGIPITLSVLTIEIGRRVGVALEGVGMPGHFLVRQVATLEGDRTDVLVDPFGAGRHLDLDGCQALYASIQGSSRGWTPEVLAATPPSAIVVRMLANLTAAYTRGNDLGGRRWVAELRAALPDRSANQRLMVASELAQTGAFSAAAEILETTADRLGGTDGDTPAAARLRVQARGVRSRLN